MGHGHPYDLDGDEADEAFFNAHHVWVRLDDPPGVTTWNSCFRPDELELA